MRKKGYAWDTVDSIKSLLCCDFRDASNLETATIHYEPTKKSKPAFVILYGKLRVSLGFKRCYGVCRTKKKHGRLFTGRVLDRVARSNRDVSDLQRKNRPWRIIAKRLLQPSFEFLFKQSILNRSIKARATMFADNELPMTSLISRF